MKKIYFYFAFCVLCFESIAIHALSLKSSLGGLAYSPDMKYVARLETESGRVKEKYNSIEAKNHDDNDKYFEVEQRPSIQIFLYQKDRYEKVSEYYLKNDVTPRRILLDNDGNIFAFGDWNPYEVTRIVVYDINGKVRKSIEENDVYNKKILKSSSRKAGENWICYQEESPKISGYDLDPPVSYVNFYDLLGNEIEIDSKNLSIRVFEGDGRCDKKKQ